MQTKLETLREQVQSKIINETRCEQRAKDPKSRGYHQVRRGVWAQALELIYALEEEA